MTSSNRGGAGWGAPRFQAVVLARAPRAPHLPPRDRMEGVLGPERLEGERAGAAGATGWPGGGVAGRCPGAWGRRRRPGSFQAAGGGRGCGRGRPAPPRRRRPWKAREPQAAAAVGLLPARVARGARGARSPTPHERRFRARALLRRHCRHLHRELVSTRPRRPGRRAPPSAVSPARPRAAPPRVRLVARVEAPEGGVRGSGRRARRQRDEGAAPPGSCRRKLGLGARGGAAGARRTGQSTPQSPDQEAAPPHPAARGAQARPPADALPPPPGPQLLKGRRGPGSPGSRRRAAGRTGRRRRGGPAPARRQVPSPPLPAPRRPRAGSPPPRAHCGGPPSASRLGSPFSRPAPRGRRGCAAGWPAAP